ncbi:MAG TPA: hypothetical protein PKA28_03625 [Methylomusa anaerophila]|uniref:Uncharacterized protein n=1 Tax=Methylomusa anaerophila TaxID=1930071 RepID=A0A348ANI1_9FIRM|nr:hypothetical protein [Methylomusa anaerophila]BBB92629.1 hypothetical protein MAMMFC1_03324 [Methylomusa anaerophila]HML87517.1 hypothetical protein [Methylomusa anaerophila]
MRKPFSRRPTPVDPAHMITLHQEAIEQLELMRSSADAAEHATDSMRDSLDSMTENHWEAYMDVLHMISLHDDSMANSIKKYGLKLRDNETEENERQWGNRLLLTLLLLGLIRRHRRFVQFYSQRGNPMGEYLRNSLAMEREHLAKFISMINYVM